MIYNPLLMCCTAHLHMVATVLQWAPLLPDLTLPQGLQSAVAPAFTHTQTHTHTHTQCPREENNITLLHTHTHTVSPTHKNTRTHTHTHTHKIAREGGVGGRE